MSATSAKVEVLTAEVRALMVGSRQVTLSVFRQLDAVESDSISPFGRVRDPRSTEWPDVVVVVGADPAGNLVRSETHRSIPTTRCIVCGDIDELASRLGAKQEGPYGHFTIDVGEELTVRAVREDITDNYQETEVAESDEFEEFLTMKSAAFIKARTLWEEWSALPLIVLAGLR